MSADESEQRTRAQVWEAIRRLSDAELERVQQLILRSHSSSSLAPNETTSPRKDAERISLTLVEASGASNQSKQAGEKIHDDDGGATKEANQADNDADDARAATRTKSRVTQWSPSDLIHAFLGHLHQVVHSQQATSASATGTVAAGGASSDSTAATKKADEKNSAQRGAKPSTSSSKSSPFALQSEDFPSLLTAPAPAATKTVSAPHKPNVKAAKRRITTTLLSDQNMITRPVLNAVAFLPLGGGGNSGNGNLDASIRAQSNNPWAKRELLERRMMSSVEPGGATSVPESPSAQSPVLTKSRVPLVNSDKSAETRDSSAAKAQQQMKKLFDDSPPGGPKQVQPFPMASSQLPDPSAAVCHSPVVTTPLKSSSAQQPPSMLLCVKPKRPRRQSLLSSATGNEADVLLSNATTSGTTLFEGEANCGALQTKPHTADDFSTNPQAAKFYGFLISKRLAGSTCAELQLLISLLFRSNCAGASSPISPASVPGLEASPAACCASLNEFCWRSHCLKFASIVLNDIEHILGSLGSEFLLLLTNALADADICADMLERLQQLAQRREELRVEESARIGCKLPVETKASAVRDFALPFCEEMDSRLHYRSPTESVMYSNREKVRDSFLDLLRQFQKQQHSLLGIESANVAASAIENANNLLAEVAPENRWWFAKFFVMELIQVGSNPFGESDKDLVLKIMEDKLVVKNPDRLRKLHRRFSSQKQSTKASNTTTPASTNPAATGTNPSHNISNNHSNKNQFGTPFSGGSNSSKSSSRSGKSDRNESNNNSNNNNNNNGSSRASPSFSSNGNSGAISATFETTRRYFAENQQFFFHFLHSCDSYEFSQLVKYQLESQFQSIWKENVNADARKSFTEVVLKLKVVAKFLGYLRFSPHWHNSSSLVQLSKQNPAFKAAKKEAIWTLENAESVGLDVKLILEQSIVESKISKCVPWLCDYLTMLSLDKLSLATTYFKQLLVLMERIYHSPRLDALSETGLYISMQIERVFHVLDFDVAGCLDDAQFKSPKLQPPASLLLVLEEVESPVQGGEDNLPFLYSQVFVQSCVNELEDLRGFIQTRAKPSHRVTKRSASGFVAGGGVSQSIPIRKLRPLQVVTEEEHNDDLLAKADAASAAAQSSSSASLLSDEDKLSESIFKIHPNLRKVVEFVVEVVATNICEHVLQQIVTPSADTFISSCVSESGLNLRERGGSSPVKAAELESATIVFLQLLENRTTRTIHESVAESLAEANRVCEAKVRASIPHLIPPSCHPTLAKSVTLMALNRTRGVVKNLIPKSSRSEFLKRVTFRKKAILKETASKSAAQASAAAEEDNVVRALSTMFDEHAGVEDSNQDDLLFALKQASAQTFKLSSTRRSKATPDEWAKLHASLSRHLRSFTSSLEELESESREAEDACPEDDTEDGEETTRREHRKIHELPVWDATWRVLVSCLRVVTGLTHSVVEWTDSEASSVEKRPESSTNALEKTVNGFVDNFVALLTLVLVGSQEAPSLQADKEAKKTEGSGDEVGARRLAGLVRVVTDYLLSKPPSLELDNLEQQDPSGLVQRLVLAPRARVLNAMASFGASPDSGGVALTSLSKESLLSRNRATPQSEGKLVVLIEN